MRMPGFTADASIYKSTESYFIAHSNQSAGVIRTAPSGVGLAGVVSAQTSRFTIGAQPRLSSDFLTDCCCPECYSWCDCCCAISGYVLKTPQRRLTAGVI